MYKLSFDPVNGFEPITLVSQQPFILVVHPCAAGAIREGAHRAREKRSPDRSNYASSGAGGSFTSARSTQEYDGRRYRPHPVTRRQLPRTTIFVAGFVQVYFGTILSTLPVVK